MNVNAKWAALRALKVEERIQRMLGDGEETPEVNGTVAMAKKIAHEAFRAGFAQARRELGFRARNENDEAPRTNKPLCSMCSRRGVKQPGDICRPCFKAYNTSQGKRP